MSLVFTKHFRIRSLRYRLPGGSLVSLVLGFLVLVVCSVHPVEAQRAGGEAPSRFMESLDPQAAAEQLEDFRNQRLAGDFSFKFVLEHLPRRDRTRYVRGILWGAWVDGTAFTRYLIDPDSGKEGPVDPSGSVELIVRSGENGGVWKRSAGKASFVEVPVEKLRDPVVEGVLYSAFDLQMPFVHWESWSYEGPDRLRSRIVQQYDFRPPTEDYGLQRVRVGIDNDYNAMLLVEVHEGTDTPETAFVVERWKKLQGQWIVRQITLEDAASGDRTRFKVLAAALGLRLSPSAFQTSEPLSAEVLMELPYEGL